MKNDVAARSETTIHVINHTHWDREWFAPFTFTRRWLPALIHNLDRVVKDNPDYQFFFDGQTEVIEDLKLTNQAAYDLARRLIKEQKLAIGPYYCQVEMRVPDAESLIRNLRVGTSTARSFGASTDFVAWNVDYFGHVSQSPQIHGLFGIHDVYLWRGPNQLAPFFNWQGPDGTTLLAINLFAGGYRNFYKVALRHELAMPRLLYEAHKLRPFYERGHIPVFDGFDLDREPGDAATYFADHHAQELAQAHIKVVNSSPYKFAEAIRRHGGQYPTMHGEQNSGKSSTVYAGLLSTRIYLKLLAAHVERLLYRYAEPLNLFLPPDKYPEQLFEEQSKLILQNLVHDVISGCGIDQIHDYAESRAAKVDEVLKANISKTLADTAAELADGVYAFTPSTGDTDTAVVLHERLYQVKNTGVGISRVEPGKMLSRPSRVVNSFQWHNAHYDASLRPDGTISLGGGSFGEFVIRADDGDTYWEEPRGDVSRLDLAGPLTIALEGEGYTEVAFTATAKTNDFTINISVTLTFDQSPVIKWRLKLNTEGVGFSLALRHNYKREVSELNVGMQFDNVERPFEDTDLLARKLSPELKRVLLNQRDLYKAFTFPFHSYISPVYNPGNVHLLATGLRAYQTEQPGYIDLVLARPVEWVMKPGFHKYHVGDAGPKFLVPGARAERETTIECGLLVDPLGPGHISFHQAVDRFINPPLLFDVTGSTGTKSHLNLFNENAPITALHQYRGHRLARLFNPTKAAIKLLQPQTSLKLDEAPDAALEKLTPKRIAAIRLPAPLSHRLPSAHEPQITLLNWPAWPVGPDASAPDPASLKQLQDMQARLQREHDSLQSIIETYGDDAPSSLLHRYYVIARENMEAKLSLKWNDLRATGALSNEDYATTVNQPLYQMATEYNDMRIVRRTYDHIVGLSEQGTSQARPAHHAATKPT